MKRFFVSCQLGKNFELKGGEHNHLANVLRVQVGESVIVCNGDEFDYVYNADKITKNSTQLCFVSRTQNIANPTKQVAVFLAIIKPDKLHTAITQLNEIGASELVLFNADRCNVSPKQINLEKLNEIARQSCKQCGRSIPIKISLTFKEPEIALAGYDRIYFADESLDLSLRDPQDFKTELCVGSSVAIIIGPEGGFTPTERAKLLKIATPISLGPRILRTETAAVCSREADVKTACILTLGCKVNWYESQLI